MSNFTDLINEEYKRTRREFEDFTEKMKILIDAQESERDPDGVTVYMDKDILDELLTKEKSIKQGLAQLEYFYSIYYDDPIFEKISPVISHINEVVYNIDLSNRFVKC